MLATLAVLAATWQGTGAPIYFVRDDSIYKSVQGHESLVLKHAVGPAPSPDGKRLAFLRDGNLYILEISTGSVHRCSDFGEKSPNDNYRDIFPSWEPTSKYVIFSHLDLYSSTRRGPAIESMFGSEHALRSLWSVYWCWGDRGVHPKGDLSLFLGNETSGMTKFTLVSSLAAAFSPDGKRVAFCRNGDLWMADLDLSTIHNNIKTASWDEARILACAIQAGGTSGTNETNSIFRLAWSPDGKLLAISSDRYGGSGGADIQVVRADNPTDRVVSFPGWDATFADANHILYVKPYTDTENIWSYTLDTKEEKIFIAHASEPAVGR